jgi:hypothetical protein
MGERNGAFRHGLHTAQMAQTRRQIAAINRAWRDLQKSL